MHVTRAEHTDLTKEDLLAKANVSIWRRLNTQGSYEDVPLVVFMYLVFTRMPGESYLRPVSYTHLTLPTNHRV